MVVSWGRWSSARRALITRALSQASEILTPAGVGAGAEAVVEDLVGLVKEEEEEEEEEEDVEPPSAETQAHETAREPAIQAEGGGQLGAGQMSPGRAGSARGC
jgi:hypothetical protein